MSSSPNTVGVATIDVNAANAVTATHRVKTRGGFVLWIVHNLTNEDVTVCVTGFTPVAGAQPLAGGAIRPFLNDDLCTTVLGPGHQGPIVGNFSGVPGSIYNYTILVNGSAAADPQLEI